MSRKRVTVQYEMRIDGGGEKVFPLLCPVLEYEWIPYWQCEILFSQTGIAELGCVFSTDFGDDFGREIWVVTHYQPCRKISFVRSGLRRTMRFEVLLSECNGTTNLLWSQEMTGLDEPGDKLVTRYAEETFPDQMRMLEKLLAYYVENGRIVDLSGMENI